MAIDFSNVTDLELMQEFQRRMNNKNDSASEKWNTFNSFGLVSIYATLNDSCCISFDFDEETGKVTSVYDYSDFFEQLDSFLQNAEYDDCVTVAKRALARL